MIKGAIFDVDGTLIDSMGTWKNLATRYLETMGKTADESLNEQLYKMSLEEGSEFLRQHYLPELSAKQVCDGFTGLLRNYYENEAAEKEGAAKLLEYLSENGVRSVIATSSVEKYARTALEKLGLMEFFERIFTCTEVGEGKSSPLIYEKCAEFLGTKPEETLVFEDAPHAVETAKKAGFITVGVYDEVNAPAFEQIKKTADKALYRLSDFRLF